MKKRLAILSCENFKAEVTAACESFGFEDVVVVGFPVRCRGQSFVWQDALEGVKRSVGPESDILVIGSSGCIPPEDSLSLGDAHVHKVNQCFYLFLNKDLVDRFLERKARLLTPGWLGDWKEKTKGIGLDRGTAHAFLGESASSLVLLDTGIDPRSREILREFSDFVGLPSEVVPVGLDYLGLTISHAIARPAQLRLEQELRTFSQAMEQNPCTIVITDLSGAIEYVNPKFCDLSGYTFQEAIGQNPRILKSGEMPPDAYKEMWDTILAGQVWRGEFHNMKKNGDLYWESASISPVRNPDGVITHFIAVKEDITDRKRVESEREQLLTELKRRASELDATNKELEAFSYSVSHDLRAPLRAVDGFSLALLEDYGDQLDEEGKHYLESVRRASQRMAQLIDDLLALSRITRAEMHRDTVDLSEIAHLIADELQKAHPDRRVRFSISPGLKAVADVRLLRIALENLLGNAWKFTSKKEHALIEFGVIEYEGRPSFYVRDDGAGFDSAYADKLFGAFQRLHSASEFPGTGIGLATVQRIIHRHGGHVWATGAIDEGAIFYFTLPSA
jgi:PAS domain S-box-containing protein